MIFFWYEVDFLIGNKIHFSIDNGNTFGYVFENRHEIVYEIVLCMFHPSCLNISYAIVITLMMKVSKPENCHTICYTIGNDVGNAVGYAVGYSIEYCTSYVMV